MGKGRESNIETEKAREKGEKVMEKGGKVGILNMR